MCPRSGPTEMCRITPIQVRELMFHHRSTEFDPRISAIAGHLRAIEKELGGIGRSASRNASASASNTGNQIASRGTAAFGCLFTRIARPIWQSWSRGGSLQCRSRPSQRLANEPPLAPGRNAQLRGSCDRQDGGRMGVFLAATKSGDNDPARRTLHPPCQSDPRTEAREAAHRRLHTALGHSTGSSFV